MESVTNTNYLLKWIINYNHSKNHDLDLKIKRTGISNFYLTLNEIIHRINILIVTFLGVDESIKNNDKIIIL